MATIRNLAGRLAAVLAWVWRMLAKGVRAVFGEWQWRAPAWAAWLGARIAAGARAFGRWMARRPAIAGIGGALLVLLVVVGVLGWRWYQHRPKPVEVTVVAQAPGRTCYECDNPKPEALLIRFGGSVAPLEVVGKDIKPGTNFEINPKVAGRWHWDDDKTLRFEPAADWPIGQKYEVSFAKHGFVASHIHLAKESVDFVTAKFEAKITENQFYQDPTTVTDKKVVVTVHFTHPVAPAEFEDAVRMSLFDKIADGKENRIGPVAFTVQYDKLKLNAYVHSEPLSVPAKEGRLQVDIDKGLHAARGGNATPAALAASVVVPGLYSLALNSLQFGLARDEHDDPSQLLLLETNFPVDEKEVVPRVHAWLLPTKNPDAKEQRQFEKENKANKDRPYPWMLPTQISDAVLKAATDLPLRYVPNEQEHVQLHSFHYEAEPGRIVYVRVDKGMKSFGGYQSADPTDTVMNVPPFPKELRITHQGSLLAMSGSKTLTVFTRDVPGLSVEVARLLPHQLQHLVTQANGPFGHPEFNRYGFTADNIAERRAFVRELPKLKPGTAHYEPIDLGEFLDKNPADRRGIFLLRVKSHDPADDKKKDDENGDTAEGGEGSEDEEGGPHPMAEDSEGEGGESGSGDEGNGDSEVSTVDTRLVVVTDMGILVKRNIDGSQDLFVQSIHSGDPVGGATVEVIGKNGEASLTGTTDETGHVHFADLKSFKGEREPVLYLARKAGDSTFMPIGRADRSLDFSRFDIGGIANVADAGKLTGYLFSDRGIYRPGDTINVGAIVKTQDWAPKLAGVPLRMEVTDPRGQTVRREALKLSAAGFEELHYATRDTSPTGEYTISLSIIKDEDRSDLIGSVTVKVQEFQPDRLKMSAHLTQESPRGWVSPEDLKANVSLQNLFGAPAENRRVTAEMTLSPSAPRFAGFEDFQFLDPQTAKEGFTDTLPDTTTDDSGAATIDLNLKRFTRATYRLHLVAQGFEADGGRGVAAEVSQLVSSLPYLVGNRPKDCQPGYVPRGGVCAAEVIAIDPKAQRIAVKGLTLARIERKYVSVLTQADNGTYKYVSKLKELKLDEKPFDIDAAGAKLIFETATPGNFAYLVLDKDGTVLNRIEYSVAGAADLSARLEKNAELQIKLSKPDYAQGEDIELQIQAPYTGAGLITIERDKVYAWKWFKATTTSSVQKIHLPEGIEGSAYVSVTFIRDAGSPEIYTSPLSYGVQPVSIDIGKRRAALTVGAPDLMKPGERLTLKVHADRPARMAAWAVDEGILQVARYKAPDPLGFFFQKRALGVRTAQILDMILPDFARDSLRAAPGGDAEGALGRHLNPFKRRTDKPVVWWSGLVDVGPADQELHYDVPDRFNGTLHLFAVAVSDAAIAAWEGKTLVRADLVLSPNAPVVVTPGDEFEVSVGVSNNAPGSGANAQVVVAAQPSSHLEILGDRTQTLPIAESHEGVAHFRVRARDELGSAELRFTASTAGKSSTLAATMSVRPATPYRVQLDAGRFAPGTQDVDVARDLYPQFRTQSAAVSVLPLTLAHGLVSYLGNYPYDCTEQLASEAMPAIVLSSRPEFGELKKYGNGSLPGLIEELRRRQNGEGAYRYWPGGVEVEPFVSVYAQLVLLEAQDHGNSVPRDLLDAGTKYLHTLAQRDGNNLDDERVAAFAIYLLTRQGEVAANEASALQKRLDDRYAKQWKGDIVAVYLAAAYKLMKQDRLAERALGGLDFGGGHTYDRWHGVLSSDAVTLYLLSRHFPERLPQLPAGLLERMAEQIHRGWYSSLSSAQTILAFDAYAKAAGDAAAGKLSIAELLKDPQDAKKTGETRALALPDGLFPKVDFTPQALKLRFGDESQVPAYYSVEQSGFDHVPPKDALKHGLEIIREYTNKDGAPLTKVKLGQEVDVRIKFRTIEHAPVWDAVIVDLLPGGFEPVIPSAPPKDAEYHAASTQDAQDDASGSDAEGSGNAEGAGEGEDAPRCACLFLLYHPPEFPSYADLREDRVVAYGSAGSDVTEYRYRIKATNLGTFTVPPAYGESMYDREVQARSTAAQIVVEKP